jgi:hypothetical protein
MGNGVSEEEREGCEETEAAERAKEAKADAAMFF